jgi:hypothetical protein
VADAVHRHSKGWQQDIIWTLAAAAAIIDHRIGAASSAAEFASIGLARDSDPYVQYRRGPKTGIPCIVHSAIAYVFATDREIDHLNREAEDWRGAGRDEEPDCDPDDGGPDF